MIFCSIYSFEPDDENILWPERRAGATIASFISLKKDEAEASGDQKLRAALGRVKSNAFSIEDLDTVGAIVIAEEQRLLAYTVADCPFPEIPGRSTPVAVDWLNNVKATARRFRDWHHTMTAAVRDAVEARDAP